MNIRMYAETKSNRMSLLTTDEIMFFGFYRVVRSTKTLSLLFPSEEEPRADICSVFPADHEPQV